MSYNLPMGSPSESGLHGLFGTLNNAYPYGRCDYFSLPFFTITAIDSSIWSIFALIIQF